jgi:hypothetical protein
LTISLHWNLRALAHFLLPVIIAGSVIIIGMELSECFIIIGMELSECIKFNLLDGVPTSASTTKMLIKSLAPWNLCMPLDEDQPYMKAKELQELGVEGTLNRRDTWKLKSRLKQQVVRFFSHKS